MSNNCIIQTEVPIGYNAEIIIKKEYKTTPPFMQIGRRGRMQGIEGLPTIQILMSLTKATQVVFLEMENFIDIDTNIIKYSPTPLTQVNRNRVSKAYREMYAKQILKRVTKKTYLINPKMFIPAKGNYSEVQKQWDALP